MALRRNFFGLRLIAALALAGTGLLALFRAGRFGRYRPFAPVVAERFAVSFAADRAGSRCGAACCCPGMSLCRNYGLCNENFIADGAVLAFRLARLRTGRFDCRIDHFRMALRRNFFGLRLIAALALAGTGLLALRSAGCFVRDRPVAPVVAKGTTDCDGQSVADRITLVALDVIRRSVRAGCLCRHLVGGLVCKDVLTATSARNRDRTVFNSKVHIIICKVVYFIFVVCNVNRISTECTRFQNLKVQSSNCSICRAIALRCAIFPDHLIWAGKDIAEYSIRQNVCVCRFDQLQLCCVKVYLKCNADNAGVIFKADGNINCLSDITLCAADADCRRIAVGLQNRSGIANGKGCCRSCFLLRSKNDSIPFSHILL